MISGSKCDYLNLKQLISHFSLKVQTENKKLIERKWRNEHPMKKRNINLPMKQPYSQR